jgi:hypothetical protein
MDYKEKAKELFDKFCYAVRTEEKEDGYFTNIIHAKRCALIVVDEILKLTPIDNRLSLTDYSYINFNYWQNVKKEIEKL